VLQVSAPSRRASRLQRDTCPSTGFPYITY
jgi:hypothetical protein